MDVGHVLEEARFLIQRQGSDAAGPLRFDTAPGAKWGDLVTGVYTAQGDLAMIAPHGIIAFAACCFYPIRFINKYWANDPTVGVKDGDGFIHNDARYGGIHNTDQSMMMPLFYKGELVCWLSSTIHEGENGACEPGGMPAAAESKYDEGIKMSPFKVVENFQLKRDLVTFLQNSVRDPKLQLEDMKVRLHSVLRLRQRIIKVLEEHGEEALIITLRKHIEDVVVEVGRITLLSGTAEREAAPGACGPARCTRRAGGAPAAPGVGPAEADPQPSEYSDQKFTSMPKRRTRPPPAQREMWNVPARAMSEAARCSARVYTPSPLPNRCSPLR